MTYHMESVALKNSLDPEPTSITPKAVERRVTFPERLWECVNDDKDLIKWSTKGDAVIVDEERFENEVMTLCPGLVAIKSFSNFRRQLRAYNFEWYVNGEGSIEFLHPYFIEGHPELVSQIQTKRKSVPPAVTGHSGNGDKMDSVGRRQKQNRRSSEGDQENEPNLEQGEIKVQDEPRQKRKYTRRKRKGGTSTRTPHSPRVNDSPRATHEYGDRPPGPPVCSCPWHCPVPWDSYEGMPQSWPKGPPPPPPPHPGYWYPPPYPPPHQQYMAQLNNQEGRTDSVARHLTNQEGETMASNIPLTEAAETQTMEQLCEVDVDQMSENKSETMSSSGQTVTTQPERPYPGPGPSVGQPTHPAPGYPMGSDPWRFQQMGGMPPFYQGMPYGVPMMGPQRPYQPYPPHMPYPYMMENTPQDQPLPQQYEQPEVLTETASQESTASKLTRVDKPIKDENEQTNGIEAIVSNENRSVDVNKTTKPERSHSTPVKIQHHQPTPVVTPSRSTIVQYLKRRQEARANPMNVEQPQPVDKPPDDVSTEQLLTNVGIQQHNMMVLMNQQEQQQEPFQQAEDEQSWQQNEYYPSPTQVHVQQISDGQTWMHHQPIDVHSWQQQQHSQQNIHHWLEQSQADGSTVNGEDVMLEVEVASQDSQSSGPLDLSSTEVTIVTMDKNIPVRLAAVVQDEESTDC